MPIDDQFSVTFRPAVEADISSIAELYGVVRRAAVPAIPPPIHSPAEDIEFFAALVSGEPDVWVAEATGDATRIVAFSVLEGAWLHSLYVAPDSTGQGIGSALLETAKATRPDGFGLWVFASNVRAQRFYLRHGLVAVRRTDGSGNEERAPDIEMLWPGKEPVGRLRQAIDEVDDQLAALLDVRAGLTASVQTHKVAPGAGQAPRDPEREAEIIARMARLAPRLGEDRLARIMQVVIAESLDAVQSVPKDE